jgi:hypothetical protein
VGGMAWEREKNRKEKREKPARRGACSVSEGKLVFEDVKMFFIKKINSKY